MDIVGTSVPSDLLRLIRLAISLNYSFLASHPSSDSPFFTPTPLYYGSIGWITTRMCFVDSETFLHSPFLITSSSLNPTCSSLTLISSPLFILDASSDRTVPVSDGKDAGQRDVCRRQRSRSYQDGHILCL